MLVHRLGHVYISKQFPSLGTPAFTAVLNFCKEPKGYDDVIECEGCSTWFHFKCIGLCSIPLTLITGSAPLVLCTDVLFLVGCNPTLFL